jgi:hypothetical protein
MHDHLVEHKIRTEMLTLDGAGHGFATDDWLKAKDASIKFLESVFGIKAE